MLKTLFLTLVLIGFMTSQVNAYEQSAVVPTNPEEELKELKDLGVKENLEAQLTMDRQFVNENGETVALGKYFDGNRPVLLTMVYYSCPSLCNYHLNGLLDTFKGMKSPVGEDFQFVAVSMNHREDSDLAAAKKETYLEQLDQEGAAAGWHHLVGTEENVKALANELGFSFRWVPETQEYAHPAVAYVVTPEGVISRYLYGIEFSPKTLRLSLVEAAAGKIGNVIDQIILFCFQFNPAKSKYTLYAYNLMRVMAGLTVLLLAVFLIPIWIRERRATC